MSSSSSSSTTGSGLLSSFSSSRLSSSELSYISGGVEANMRSDGRTRLDFRGLTLSTGVVVHANGSARLKLEQTDVMVAVNMSMAVPDATKSRCEGMLVCSVEQSAACTAGMDDRAIQSRNQLLTADLNRLLSHTPAIPLTSLVIVPDKQVWQINVDVLVLEDGGNLFDAIVMATKAALVTTTVPPIEVISGDAGQVEIIVNDDPFSHILLPHAPSLPLVISLCKIGSGGEWILDPTADEEECMSMRVALAVNPMGHTCGMTKSGLGTINQVALENIISHATDMAVVLDRKLMDLVRSTDKKYANAEKKKLAMAAAATNKDSNSKTAPAKSSSNNNNNNTSEKSSSNNNNNNNSSSNSQKKKNKKGNAMTD